MAPMLPFERYRADVLARVRAGEPRAVPVAESLGLVLAQEVRAGTDLPAFTNSAMDGYAVRAADVAGSPTRLPVVGDVPAGDLEQKVLPAGTALRIMTGAALPDGADAVVPVELTDGGTGTVEIQRGVREGNAVRVQGEDVHLGDPLVAAGTLVLPHHLSALIAAGVATVNVYPRPRVGVVATGDELVPAGQPLRRGQIHDSNGPTLAALVTHAGGVVTRREHVRDGDDLAAVVDAMLEEVDLVVTSGGVSAGAYEPVKDAYPDGPVEFFSVAMQPGKPQGFGLVGPREVPLFALPGNPVSTLVSFQTFVLPALRRIAGLPEPGGARTARVAQGWTPPAARTQMARVRLEAVDGELSISASGAAGSHILGGLAAAQAIAVVPAEQEQVRTGDELEVQLLPGERWPDV